MMGTSETKKNLILSDRFVMSIWSPNDIKYIDGEIIPHCINFSGTAV